MIACALACVNFFFGLRVAHSGIDALEDLALRQTGVFEPGNFRAGHDGVAIQMAVKDELNGRVRKSDELEGDGVDADGIELVGAGNLEDLRVAKSRASQVGSGFGARKEMLAHVRGTDELDARVVCDPSPLQSDDLGNFLVGGIEAFELLDIAGEHSRLIQRTVVRQRMLVAAGRREDAHTEKQSLVPHIYIVGGEKRETGLCAWMIPGRKDR